MYKYKSKCIVCGEENVISLKTKEKDIPSSDYYILNKNEDGTYKIEILSKCNYCKFTHKEIKDVALEDYI